MEMKEIPTRIPQKKEFVVIEENLYPAELVRIEQDKGVIKKNGEADKEVDVCYLYFDIKYAHDKEKVTLRHKCYLPATPNNKLGKALMAMGYDDFTKPINVKVLIGKRVRVFVEKYKTKDLEDKEVVRNTVTKVKPLEEQVI